MQRNPLTPARMPGTRLVADDLGQVKVSPWLERVEGKWSVLDGAGPGAPGLQDPSSVLWDHMEKSLNLSSSAASSVTKGKGECVRQEHPSWGLLGHSTRTLGGPGQDRAGDDPMGHRRDGEKLQCETRALPASLEQETQRKEPAECVSLGKHSWVEPPDPPGDEIVQDHPRQDCPSSTGGVRGLVRGQSVQPPPPSAPATGDSGCSLPCWLLSSPGSMQAQPQQAPVQAEV